MQLHLQNPVNWACFTGLEDYDKVIIIMNTAQISVTLGLLKLTLNKLIHCHSSMPLLSTLQHHCSITTPAPPSRAVCMAQSSVVTWLLPENSTAQAMMPLSRHWPLLARCQARIGLHRNLQLFTSSASGIPALEMLITTQASSSHPGAHQLSTCDR